MRHPLPKLTATMTYLPTYINKRAEFTADLVLSLFFILMVVLFKQFIDIILISAWIFAFVYLVLQRRYRSLLHQVMATVLAITWVSFAKNYYGYQADYQKFFGLNSLPLLAWTLTLLCLGELCDKFNLGSKAYNFLVFVPAFWFFLILFETAAYHWLGLRNAFTKSYPGLPVCDCIHAPRWMQAAYFSMGPFYYFMILMADQFVGRWRTLVTGEQEHPVLP